MRKIAKVIGEAGLIKDLSSGAVLSNDRAALEMRKLMKGQIKKKSELERIERLEAALSTALSRIEKLEREVASIR